MGFPVPTANMHAMLNLPATHPRWATDALATLEPPDGQKDTGWLASEKAPARWMNWILNLLSGWTHSIAAAVVSNWFEGDDITAGAVDCNSLIYHPANRLWLGLAEGAVATYLSATGHNWFAGGNLSAFPAPQPHHAIGIDSQYFLVGTTSGDLNYSMNGAVWSQILSATIGGAGSISSIATKYPNDDMTIVLRQNSQPRIAAAGIAGSWVGATTPPTSKAQPLRVLHLGGSTWATLSADAGYTNAILSISNDDGDTWATSAANPTATVLFYDMAYDPDTGRIVLVGDYPGAPWIEYTDDLGVTWQTANPPPPFPFTQTLWSVYYCGGGLWVAVGEYTAGHPNRPHVQASKDDGTTWEIVGVMGPPGYTNTNDFYAVACDGRKLLAGGTSGVTLATISLV